MIKFFEDEQDLYNIYLYIQGLRSKKIRKSDTKRSKDFESNTNSFLEIYERIKEKKEKRDPEKKYKTQGFGYCFAHDKKFSRELFRRCKSRASYFSDKFRANDEI